MSGSERVEQITGCPRPEPRPVRRDDARIDHATATEVVVGSVLRYGVAVSLALITVGVILMFATGSTGYGENLGPASFVGSTGGEAIAWPRSLGGVFEGALASRPYALILCGLLLLIATPIVRVVLSVVTFLIEGDYQYVLITLGVLAVLLLSFLLGAAEGRG